MAANFWSSSQCDLLLEARERRAEEASRAPKPKARPRRRQIVLRGVEPEPGEPGSSGGGPGSVVTQLVDYAVLLSKELKIRQRPVLTACAYLWRLRPETLGLHIGTQSANYPRLAPGPGEPPWCRGRRADTKEPTLGARDQPC